MPRTAPAVDGSGNYRQVTIKWIDANNGKRSDTFEVSAAATDAQIEAVIVAMAAASNANIYQVKVTMVYNSVMNVGDALDAPRESVKDNIVFLFKDSANNAVDWFLPAPLDSLFFAGTNTPDASEPVLQAVRDAIDAALAVAYQPVTYRFSERRKKNASVPA